MKRNKGLKLEKLCEMFGVTTPRFHSALHDTTALRSVLQHLVQYSTVNVSLVSALCNFAHTGAFECQNTLSVPSAKHAVSKESFEPPKRSKPYNCSRCGQIKKGHTCTNPDVSKTSKKFKLVK